MGQEMPTKDPEKIRQEATRKRNAYRLKHGIPLDAPVASTNVRYATEEERRAAYLDVKRRASAKLRAPKKEAIRIAREARQEAKRNAEEAAKAAREAKRVERERQREWAKIAARAAKEREAAKREVAKCSAKSGNGTTPTKGSNLRADTNLKKRGRILALSGWLGW